jgi:hypothetical protein
MIHMSYEMDVDHGNCLYKMLFDNTCMISICCKLMMLSMAETWLKVIKTRCFRLMSLYHLKSCMSRCQTGWS